MPKLSRERPLRSVLFAPANEPRKTSKLATFGADAIVLDLEDAVAKDEKIAARQIARDALPGLVGPVRVIRVNGWDTGLTVGDVEAIVSADVDAIMLPKIETARDLTRLDDLLTHCEHRAGLEVGHVQVIGLIETCLGVLAAADIVRASQRLQQVAFGSGDLGKDLGLPVMRADITAALAYGRSKLVYDCRAAGLPGPLDGPYLAVRDSEGLKQDCEAARALGHRGKICIHPSQVAIANDVFSPDAGEVAFARKVIDAFKAAEAEGSASITVEGTFVDYPILDQAERLVALAEDVAARDSE